MLDCIDRCTATSAVLVLERMGPAPALGVRVHSSPMPPARPASRAAVTSSKSVSVPDKIEYASLDELHLDPRNPRLGRERVAKGLSQSEVLDLMKDWTLEELATSFCESGYWPQEALIAVREKMGSKTVLVVVEGNRRLAALKMLSLAAKGDLSGGTWRSLVEVTAPGRMKDLSTRIPYMLMPDRASVKAYLGFRHVTGIKEWRPAEKAQFIADLIDGDKLTYEQVRRRIGSKLPTVRQNYIAYRLLMQMENASSTVDTEKVEERFSVLYLSLRTEGVRQYLHIKIDADPKAAQKPVPDKHLKQLENFALWLFGNSKHEPLFTDSRKVDDFGRILTSDKAVEYLERNERPSFEVAKRMSGVSEAQVATHIETAADETEEALRAAHLHKASHRVTEATLRLSKDVVQLAKLFPSVVESIEKDLK